jgi:hypothetical protein
MSSEDYQIQFVPRAERAYRVEGVDYIVMPRIGVVPVWRTVARFRTRTEAETYIADCRQARA